MTDENQNISDFLNDDDPDEFDIEKLAREYERAGFGETENGESTGSEELYVNSTSADSIENPQELANALENASLANEETTDPNRHRPVSDESFSITPPAIVEGMLFVGNSENQSIPPEKMSALMRGVSADEIDEIVSQLNASYRETNSPFEIIFENDGYRLVLAKGYEFCRQRFYREEIAATLSQSVVDVLSLVAYLQPVTRQQIEEKRLKPCGSILNQLIRRKLVEVDRQKVDRKTLVLYRTTSRFLDLFGIDSLDELPKSQAFDGPG